MQGVSSSQTRFKQTKESPAGRFFVGIDISLFSCYESIISIVGDCDMFFFIDIAARNGDPIPWEPLGEVPEGVVWLEKMGAFFCVIDDARNRTGPEFHSFRFLEDGRLVGELGAQSQILDVRDGCRPGAPFFSLRFLSDGTLIGRRDDMDCVVGKKGHPISKRYREVYLQGDRLMGKTPNRSVEQILLDLRTVRV